MQRAERRGTAMGSDLHVIVWASAHAARLADLAVRRVDLLERCWSRFRPDSELSRLNARAGLGTVPVSADLHHLVTAMVEAYTWSEGDVDASVLGAMVAMGYDSDFRAVAAIPLPPTWDLRPGAGMSAVHVIEGAIALPQGTGLDPGAIGKGLAGDIVTAEIADAGATAVLVGIGGDVVTAGVPPDSAGWCVTACDDRTPGRDAFDVITLVGEQRAVATSSALRRRWSGRHHVLDPRTGLPAASGVVQATVVADRGWRAEAGATVGLLRGHSAIEWLAARGCPALLLDGMAAHA